MIRGTEVILTEIKGTKVSPTDIMQTEIKGTEVRATGRGRLVQRHRDH